MQQSEPISLDHGYVEDMRVDVAYFEQVNGVEINGYTIGFRPQFVITVTNMSAKVPDTIDVVNGFFELKATTQETQKAVTGEIDEGFLEYTEIDIAGFDGVKGVEFTL